MGFTLEQRDQFQFLYTKACEMKDHSKIVQLADQMIQLMLQAGEAKIKNVPCKGVIVHPSNRGSAAMQARKFLIKGSKILSMGFSLARCGPDRAVGFEPNPLKLGEMVDSFLKNLQQ